MIIVQCQAALPQGEIQHDLDRQRTVSGWPAPAGLDVDDYIGRRKKKKKQDDKQDATDKNQIRKSFQMLQTYLL